MGQNRRTRRQLSKKARTRPPMPPAGSVTFIEGVSLDGQPYGVVFGYWCNDPECQERHR